MKIYQSFFLTFLFALGVCYSQVNINNIQVAATLVSVDAFTPNSPYSYNWSGITNTKQEIMKLNFLPQADPPLAEMHQNYQVEFISTECKVEIIYQ